MKKIKERSQSFFQGQPLCADEVNHAGDADFQELTLTSPSVGLELVINGCSSGRRKPG